MRRAFLHLGIGIAFLVGNLAAQTLYFPEKTFGDDPQVDRFVSGWYSHQLRALGEPSLLESSKAPSTESYRFLWLRSFHHPIAVRLDVQKDGTGLLITKIASGAGGYPPGKLISDRTAALYQGEIQRVIARINGSGFWSIPSYSRERAGDDGSEWVLEAAVHGKYHLVSVWTPKNGPIHDLGEMFLFDLAKIRVPKDEFY
jgi:hypothetical protein